MKYLLLTGALLLSSMPASALAAEKWDYQQEVSYQEYHDPLMVWLSDGRKLAVSLGPSSLKKSIPGNAAVS